MDIDPTKTISWAKGTLSEPMVKVKTTKTKEPPKIHQFTFVVFKFSGKFLLSCLNNSCCLCFK
ncbi:MAG: hypothetical protein ACKPKO_55125 [Candidatus Fonsibacter sp.]